MEAFQTFLLRYRTTPNLTLGNRSPAEVLLGRQLRASADLVQSTLPATVWKNSKMGRDILIDDMEFSTIPSDEVTSCSSEIIFSRKRDERMEWSYGDVALSPTTFRFGRATSINVVEGAPRMTAVQQMQRSPRYWTNLMPRQSHQPSRSRQWTSYSYKNRHSDNRTSTVNCQLRFPWVSAAPINNWLLRRFTAFQLGSSVQDIPWKDRCWTVTDRSWTQVDGSTLQRADVGYGTEEPTQDIFL